MHRPQYGIVAGRQTLAARPRCLPVLAIALFVLAACSVGSEQSVEPTETPTPAVTATVDSTPVVTQVESTTTTTEPIPAVIDELLNILESKAYVRDQIDWEEARADTYRVFGLAGVDVAIERAMAYVSRIDRHSFWVVPASQAEAPLGTSVPSPVEVDSMDDEIAVVTLGAFGNPDPALPTHM